MTAPGVFYPPGADSAEERLRYYASRFPVVEVDATYYAVPARRTAEALTIALLHDPIAAAECRPSGRHHEIYLGDPRRAAPAKPRTLIRQPVEACDPADAAGCGE